MVAAGNRLVLADAAGLRTFDLTNPERPQAAHSFPMEGLRGIETTALGGSQRVLAELSDGRFAVVDVAGELPYIAARYFQRPWFAGSAKLRDVTVRPSGPGTIDVFTPGTKKTMRF
jgi:hypothetical protein